MVRERPPRLNLPDRDRFIGRFLLHMRRQYVVIPVTDNLYDRAADLCRVHPLRAYDAIQLACALTTRDDALAIGSLPPTFVCADVALLTVAGAEGLPIENPNDRP
jgi:hypothetical protein